MKMDRQIYTGKLFRQIKIACNKAGIERIIFGNLKASEDLYFKNKKIYIGITPFEVFDSQINLRKYIIEILLHELSHLLAAPKSRRFSKDFGIDELSQIFQDLEEVRARIIENSLKKKLKLKHYKTIYSAAGKIYYNRLVDNDLWKSHILSWLKEEKENINQEIDRIFDNEKQTKPIYKKHIVLLDEAAC